MSHAQNFIKDKRFFYEQSFELVNSLALPSSYAGLAAVETLHSVVWYEPTSQSYSISGGIGVGYMSFSGTSHPRDIVSDLELQIGSVNIMRNAPYVRLSLALRFNEMRKIRDRLIPYIAFNFYHMFINNPWETYAVYHTYPDLPDVSIMSPGVLYLDNKYVSLELGTELKTDKRVRFYMGLTANSMNIGGTGEITSVSWLSDTPENKYNSSYWFDGASVKVCLKLGVRL